MINNILEMRSDYDMICERVSELRELPTRAERRKEAVAIIEDHKLQFEARQLADMIGWEFL